MVTSVPRMNNGSINRSDPEMFNSMGANGTGVPRGQLINFDSGRESGGADIFEQQDMKYDSTGMFHWCPARSIEECILDRNQV